MRIFSRCFREYICHIFDFLYVGVVDNSLSMQISTVVIPNFDVFSLSFDDSHGDKCESTLTVTADWQRW